MITGARELEALLLINMLDLHHVKFSDFLILVHFLKIVIHLSHSPFPFSFLVAVVY